MQVKNSLWRRYARKILCAILNERARRMLTLGSIVGAVLPDDDLTELINTGNSSVLKALVFLEICYNPKAIMFPLMLNVYLINDEVKASLTEFFNQPNQRDYDEMAVYLLDELPVWLYYDKLKLREDLKLLARYKEKVFHIA